MYKITVIVSKQEARNEALAVSHFGKSIEEVKGEIETLVLNVAKRFGASGKVTIGMIIEEHGKFYESDTQNAIVSRDFKNITYKF